MTLNQKHDKKLEPDVIFEQRLEFTIIKLIQGSNIHGIKVAGLAILYTSKEEGLRTCPKILNIL